MTEISAVKTDGITYESRSITKYDSYDALEITRTAMETIFMAHNVSPDVLTTLIATEDPPERSEEGFGGALINRYGESGYDLTYLFRYHEQRGDSWKFRQTGVFHPWDRKNDRHLYILLHPRRQSTFQSKIELLLDDSDQSGFSYTEPLVLHRLLFQSYSTNWRAYLRDKSVEYLPSAEELLALDHASNQYIDVSLQKFQWWRDLEDRLMPASSILQATIDLLEALGQIEGEFHLEQGHRPLHFFRSRKTVVTAYMRSADGLRKRIHSAINLLRDILELKTQEELQEINRNLLKLQSESVDDNETVRVITVVTLVYLPGSFVVALLGTNLFFFNPATSRIRIADNVWWYLVLFVPLMATTIGIWLQKTRKARKQRHARKAAVSIASDQISPLAL